MNDPYIECPYNKTHLVPRSRIQNHIIKCQLKSPEELKVCPFNATHRVKPEQLKNHTDTCPARINIFRYEHELPLEDDLMKKAKLQNQGYDKQVKNVLQLDPDDEMWDN